MKINLRELFTDAILPTETVEKSDLTFENVDNNSATNELYEAREEYKKKVNDENLPIGVENFRGQVLKNQLDTWYKDLNYGKYDYDSRLLRLKNNAKLRQVGDTEFQLLDFVADAVEGFLEQYNVDRRAHPQSILNDLTVLRAYEPQKLYQAHVQTTYEQFFNDILQPIRNTDKIKNFSDFMNLFYGWFLDNNTFISEAGFYENAQYNLYNTGLVFDFFEINSESDKERVLKDPRYPVINYVAKINGLRIDPNNPGRLIADIDSKPLVLNYAKKYFPNEDINDIPKLIFDKYFETINFENSSEDVIVKTLSSIGLAYNRFINKYGTFTKFNAPQDITQNYKKKFSSNSADRKPITEETFYTVEEQGYSTVNLFSVENYVKIRAKEKSVALTNKELDYVVKSILNYININNGLLYNNDITEKENENVRPQAINFLETFLSSKKSSISSGKKQFIHFWRRSSDL